MSTLRTRIVVVAAAGAVTAAGSAVVAAPADAAPASCSNSALAVTRTFTQGAAGTQGMALIYRNTTRHTCSVAGYPGLDAVTSKGHVLAHARRAGATHPRTVSIKPGRYASAGVRWSTIDGAGSCRYAAGVVTTVADTSRAHRVRVRVSVCDLRVQPTVGGTPGYPHYGPAQHAWIQGSHVDAAGIDRYLRNAAYALKRGGAFPTQVEELAQLISFPETGLTAKQVKQARADVSDLDSFFATPGLY